MRRLTIPLLVLVAFLGCSSPSPGADLEVPTEAPFIEGVVTQVTDAGILVEESPNEVSGSAKAMLRITPTTAIFWRSADPAGRLDLRLGTRVRAWVAGPVMESYPVQAAARAIVIISVDLPVQHPA